MIILAGDTSSSQGSVALRSPDGAIYKEDLDSSRPHSETLLPAVEEILSAAGINKGSIEAIAVGTGPGSFTGLRVGLATFQGWAAALNLPLVPVISMDAVAWPLVKKGLAAIVLADARKGEVYAAYYPSANRDVLPVRSGEIILISRAEVPEWINSLDDPDARIVGTAVPEFLKAGYHFPGNENHNSSGVPDAEYVLALAEKLYELGRIVAPGDLVPTYVRTPDARKPAPGTIITASAPNRGDQ